MKKVLSFLFLFALLAASVTVPAFRLTATAADEPVFDEAHTITTNTQFQSIYASGEGVYLLDPAEGQTFTIPSNKTLKKSLKLVANKDVTINYTPGGSNQGRASLDSGCDLVFGDENSTATITLASTNPTTACNAVYVFTNASAKLTLNHCVVTGFKTTNGNGFVAPTKDGTFTLNDVEFKGNSLPLVNKSYANVIFAGEFYAHDNAAALFATSSSALTLSFTAADYHYAVGTSVYETMPDGFEETLRKTAKDGSVKIEAHDLIKTADATCTENGALTCSCGKTQAISALGHKASESDTEVEYTVATTVSYYNGETTRDVVLTGKYRVNYCANGCGTILSYDVVDHTHEYGEWQEIPSTCIVQGERYRICSVCTYRDSILLDLADHTPVTDARVEPGCLATGLTEGSHCSVCTAVLVAQQEIAAQGHLFGDEWTTDVPVGCETNGHKYRLCTRCGGEEIGGKEEADLLPQGHVYVDHTGKAPSCNEVGWLPYRTCENCDFTEYKERPAIGHDLTQYDALEASCEAVGHNAYEVCSRCDYTTYEEYPALGHDDVTVGAIAPECEKEGYSAGIMCSRCNRFAVEPETIPATGHSFVNVVVTVADCNNEGVDEIRCENCDLLSETITSSKLTHHYVETVLRVPTVEEDGELALVCERCGAVRKGSNEPIPKVVPDEPDPFADGVTFEAIVEWVVDFLSDLYAWVSAFVSDLLTYL